MLTNAPIERILNAIMVMDGMTNVPGHRLESTCLQRKLEWLANEAEMHLKRLQPTAKQGN